MLRLGGGASVACNAGAPTSGGSGTFQGTFLALPGALLIDTTNCVLYQNTNTKASPTWSAIWSSGANSLPAEFQGSPADPTGTTSTSAAVMMGFGASPALALITPVRSTRMLLQIEGLVTQTTGNGSNLQLSYGTGAAPANGAALAGTQVGSAETITALTGELTLPFSLTAIVTGLTVGTAYWLDLAVKAVTGGTASPKSCSVTAVEI
jgi:hypothetical protein